MLTRASYAITVGRTPCPPPEIPAPVPAHELLSWASGTDIIPYTVTLTEPGIRRIGEFIECAFRHPADYLWASAAPMAAVERAATGVTAHERVVDLWTGLESTLPAPPGTSDLDQVLDWADAAEHAVPGFMRAVEAITPGAVPTLLAARSRIALLPDVRPGLRRRLQSRVSRRRDRFLTALAVVYAIRNGVVHGSMSARSGAELEAVRAADQLAWPVLDARLSELICGSIAQPAVSRHRVGVTV